MIDNAAGNFCIRRSGEIDFSPRIIGRILKCRCRQNILFEGQGSVVHIVNPLLRHGRIWAHTAHGMRFEKGVLRIYGDIAAQKNACGTGSQIEAVEQRMTVLFFIISQLDFCYRLSLQTNTHGAEIIPLEAARKLQGGS